MNLEASYKVVESRKTSSIKECHVEPKWRDRTMFPVATRCCAKAGVIAVSNSIHSSSWDFVTRVCCRDRIAGRATLSPWLFWHPSFVVVGFWSRTCLQQHEHHHFERTGMYSESYLGERFFD
jgi:hypothetical protein